MDFDFKFFLEAMVHAIRRIPISFYAAVMVLIIGTIAGFLVSLARFYKVKFLGEFLRSIITILRGVPVILFLLIFQAVAAFTYDDFMAKIGLNISYRNLNKIYIAIAALSIPTMVNMSEIFRGCFAAIDRSQFDASHSIGHRAKQTLFRVVLPQMIPIAVPMMGNVIIGTIKATSLLMYVTVIDILNGAILSAAYSYRYLEAYVSAAVIFWIICLGLEQVFRLVENRSKQQRTA